MSDTDACPPVVLVNMAELRKLFPHKTKETVYRWNTEAGKGNRLPEPDLVLGDVSLWTLDTIRLWAATRRKELVPDPEAIRKLCGSALIR